MTRCAFCARKFGDSYKTKALNGHRANFDGSKTGFLRLRDYLNAGGDDLIACCGWLGGERGRLLAQSLVHSVLRGDTTEPLQVNLLGRVHALLALELLDDLDSNEAQIFKDLDLNDVRVGNCCLHTDALATFLRAFGTVGASDRSTAVKFTDAAA